MSGNDPVSKHAKYEEFINALTHGVGILLFSMGSVALVIKGFLSGNVWEIFSAFVFGGALILLYTSSTLYHAIKDPGLKSIFQKIDHSAIFILIAGTYTPFLLVALRQYVHISFVIVMWLIALAGIIYKIFAKRRRKLISTIIYLSMGWMAVFKAWDFYEYLPIQASVWVLIGGLFYSLGTIFYSRDHLHYNHALWHLFVLCGSASHFIAIYLYVY